MTFTTSIWQEYEDEETEETYEAEVEVEVEYDQPDGSVGYCGHMKVLSARFLHNNEPTTLCDNELYDLQTEADAYARGNRAR